MATTRKMCDFVPLYPPYPTAEQHFHLGVPRVGAVEEEGMGREFLRYLK